MEPGRAAGPELLCWEAGKHRLFCLVELELCTLGVHGGRRGSSWRAVCRVP